MNQQQGMTLFIVIIVLVVATSLAAAVITESRVGLSSIGFTQDKLENEQALLSGVDEIMKDTGLIDKVMALESGASSAMTSGTFKTEASMTLRGESYCKRSNNASSLNIINCRFVRINFSQSSEDQIGKGNRMQGSKMTTGIEQPFLATNNN